MSGRSDRRRPRALGPWREGAAAGLILGLAFLLGDIDSLQRWAQPAAPAPARHRPKPRNGVISEPLAAPEAATGSVAVLPQGYAALTRDTETPAAASEETPLTLAAINQAMADEDPRRALELVAQYLEAGHDRKTLLALKATIEILYPEETGGSDAATETLRQLLTLDPQHREAREHFVALHRGRGQLAEAAHFLGSLPGAQHHPKQAQEIGELYLASGDNERAVSYFEGAGRRLSSSTAQALADAYTHLGRYQEAEEIYWRLAEQSDQEGDEPKSDDSAQRGRDQRNRAYLRLMQHAALQQDLDKAEAIYDTYLRPDLGDDPEYLRKLASQMTPPPAAPEGAEPEEP